MTDGIRCRTSVERDVFTPPHTHMQLEAIEPIQPADSLSIDQPVFAAQEHTQH
jgi:hypothetical protein